jgi:transketolase
VPEVLQAPQKPAAAASAAAPGEDRMVDPRDVRRTCIDILYRGKAGHLGCSMSAVEMLVAMYGFVDVDKIRRHDPDRSRIIISKGHCAAATYATMSHYGLLDRETLYTYHQQGSILTGLVNHNVPGVEHSTGSLGHGLSVGVGAAIALRNRGADESCVLTLVGDGEVHEGSNWEAWMLAAHLRLNNFITLIDDNHIGMIRRTHEVLDMRPLGKRFEGFGFRVFNVDGHDHRAVFAALHEARHGGAMPAVIICDTVKGKGVPFAEWEPIWHYRNLNDKTYKEAIEHLDKCEGR